MLADQLIEPTVVKDAIDEADQNEAADPEQESTPDDTNSVANESAETEETETREIEIITSEEEPTEINVDAAGDNEEDVAFSVSESGELVEKPEEE
ncbi:MAG: hypothetical protein NVV59_12640 [Chitinophagaceae bacterium]|nr:hypothetical protein [Chitinophagaceae bacterium]